MVAPHPTALHRLDQNARRLLPIAISLLLAFAVILPIGLPQWGMLAPPFLLIAIFYWSIVRPDLLPPTAAFVLGLFQDLLTGAPLGSGALIMVVTQWTMRGQQRYLINRPFLLMWAAFAPVAIIAGALDWLIYALLNFHIVPIGSALVRIALGIILFPVVAWVVLIPTHRTLPPAS
jgi:rod shape-determining protein MreD